MANRVTDSQVKEIIETALATTPFIDTANLLINEHLSEVGYSAEYLTKMELYLAAHFVALRERQATKEKIGDAETTYGGTFGQGLDFTQFGQTLKMMDTSGIFEALGKVHASVTFIA